MPENEYPTTEHNHNSRHMAFVVDHDSQQQGVDRLSKVYRPTKHIIGNIGDDLMGHDQPTVSKH